MKKFILKTITIAISLCMIFSYAFALIGCGHEHTFASEWSCDETHHWKNCTTENCEEKDELNTHTFVDGTCSVCSKHVCDFKVEWTYNQTHHWHDCKDASCTERSGYSEHSLTNNLCECGYSAVTYTVTEDEWKVNFRLTKGQQVAQPLSFAERLSSVTEITSYTIYAVGENNGVEGTSLLKVAPNAMSIEFYIGTTLREDESGTYSNTDILYQSMSKNIMSYFPFENNYANFTYDEVKKAYVGQNITSLSYDEYNPNNVRYTYTKTAEVTFVNGYLNTVTVELCGQDFGDTFASFVFTFSNINNTTVSE